ncbi:MAG: hypothetical protein EHM85_08030 [Desulfobacteraceae bacterium]|nr:MAG: hypothetical protein EHM85_08030 [Desulfobacteraceae bacterium]
MGSMIRNSYQSYHEEQLEALLMVAEHLGPQGSGVRRELGDMTAGYVSFRSEVDNFLSENFSDICNDKCYRSNLSACCSREGIITFFADVAINLLVSGPGDIAALRAVLEKENRGVKCVYLGNNGCLWRLKPVVCEMFLCDTARNKVFGRKPALMNNWTALKKKEKSFTWPDRPVLFDKIESYFRAAGFSSSLMYMHNSPGLLRVKKRATIRDA